MIRPEARFWLVGRSLVKPGAARERARSMLGRRLVARLLRRRWAPRAAGGDEIDAHLDLFFAELLELTAPGRDLADLDEAVADASARAEEWTDTWREAREARRMRVTPPSRPRWGASR